MTDMECGTCRFFKPWKTWDGQRGNCCYNPPSFMGEETGCDFATTGVEYWCSKWEERKDDGDPERKAD